MWIGTRRGRIQSEARFGCLTAKSSYAKEMRRHSLAASGTSYPLFAATLACGRQERPSTRYVPDSGTFGDPIPGKTSTRTA
jgi:hypothetical protein